MKLTPINSIASYKNYTSNSITKEKNSFNHPENIRNKTNFIYPKNYYISNNISFGYNFKLKNARNLPCAYCGEIMYSQEDIKNFCFLKGDELAKVLNSTLTNCPQLFSKRYEEAIQKVAKIAQDNKEKSLAELLPLIYIKSRSRVIEKQKVIYRQIKEFAKEANCQELVEYTNKVSTQDKAFSENVTSEEILNFLKNDSYLQYRKDVEEKIRLFHNKYCTEDENNTIIWDKILEHTKNLPSSYNDSDALLLKITKNAFRKNTKGIEEYYETANASSSEIFFTNLLSQMLTSAEHIKPHSKNGNSNLSNYLVVHKGCNSSRSSIPFYQYLTDNPEVKDNILKNLQAVQNSFEADKKLYRVGSNIYITLVSNEIKKQLTPISKRKDIKKFFNQLDSISQSSNPENFTSYKEYNSASKNFATKTIGFIAFDTSLKFNKKQERYSKIYKVILNTLKNRREIKYRTTIKNSNKLGLGPELKAYIEDFKNDDLFLNLKPDMQISKTLRSKKAIEQARKNKAREIKTKFIEQRPHLNKSQKAFLQNLSGKLIPDNPKEFLTLLILSDSYDKKTKTFSEFYIKKTLSEINGSDCYNAKNKRTE